MALMQAYEVRALVEEPRAKEGNGILLFSTEFEPKAREAFNEAVGEMLVGVSTKREGLDRWVGITLTGPNGVFERSMRTRQHQNAQAGPQA